MKNIWNELKNKHHKRYLGGLDIFKYIGPGLLVTVGFIDPGIGHPILLPAPNSDMHSCG